MPGAGGGGEVTTLGIIRGTTRWETDDWWQPGQRSRYSRDQACRCCGRPIQNHTNRLCRSCRNKTKSTEVQAQVRALLAYKEKWGNG